MPWFSCSYGEPFQVARPKVTSIKEPRSVAALFDSGDYLMFRLENVDTVVVDNVNVHVC